MGGTPAKLDVAWVQVEVAVDSLPFATLAVAPAPAPAQPVAVAASGAAAVVAQPVVKGKQLLLGVAVDVASLADRGAVHRHHPETSSACVRAQRGS